jgi:phosphate butyryltransferase
MLRTFDALIEQARQAPRTRIAVVAPRNEETFSAIREALASLPVEFLLAGDPEQISSGLGSPDRVTVLPSADFPRALAACLAAVRDGSAGMLMKGSIDTGALMRGVLDGTTGIRAGRLMSDVSLFEYPRTGRFLMITDGGITIAPTLAEKADLIRNAVLVAHALGIPRPAVAVLSATEKVTPALPSTLDAVELAAMNTRGEITGCIVDGPFALDNAVDPDAAKEKGITSPVAGNADILLLPTIEAANALAKSTTYFAGFRLAHVVVGARVPLLIPSRADRSDTKLLSIALGLVMAAATSSPSGR